MRIKKETHFETMPGHGCGHSDRTIRRYDLLKFKASCHRCGKIVFFTINQPFRLLTEESEIPMDSILPFDKTTQHRFDLFPGV
jgi:hypothetical protein